MNAVTCQDLSYAYGNDIALDQISMEIGAGELFGLIGPDGAGKTTLFRILASLMVFKQGRATVLGYDPIKDYREIRTRIGYMPGRFSLYQDLTVTENLKFYASVFGVSFQKNLGLIEKVYSQIKPFKNRRAGRLSGGMKQKLALSCALIHQPDLLILDEPTTGVDAVSRVEFWDLLKDLQKSGMTILVSTPYMDEARRCDRIGLMQRGQLLSLETPNKVARSFDGFLYRIRVKQAYQLKDFLNQHPIISMAYLNGQYLNVVILKDDAEEITNLLRQAGYDGIRPERTDPTVEDRFIQLMSKNND